ncbi:MAG TPA: hypothetical protein VMB78_03400 [Dissulfurispiraceae bacterium]|nr:hypothetical protein [Dissulfurispiraceae bacterium]
MNIRLAAAKILLSIAGMGLVALFNIALADKSEAVGFNTEIYDYFSDRQKYLAMDVKPAREPLAPDSGNRRQIRTEQKREIPAIVAPVNVPTGAATITSEILDYFKEEQRYVAKGNVRIAKDGSIITADSAVYFNESADAELTGNVTIENNDYLIKTDQADYNLDDGTGTLKKADIYVKKDKYWISGVDMQKLGDHHYRAKKAYFSACDSESYRTAEILTSDKIPVSQRPDWCFRGDDADLLIGDKMTAKNATFRVKNSPVLYSPYFWTSLGNDRQTGFEIPAVGTDSRKGMRYSQSFFWAIDENKDATFTGDYFSKRGVGTGVEYRFLDFNHEGKWYAYHISDRYLNQSLWEVKVTDKYKTGNIQTFLDVNYINSEVYYKEYPKDFVTNISRFLQSTGEASLPFDNSRAYLLAQHWVNLREGLSEHVPQKLPELGYVINPTLLGPAIFTLQANAANFYRTLDPGGQRLDLQPTLSYSFGDAIRLTQAVSLRETYYNLTNGGTFGSSAHRELFQYDAQAQMRFLRDYGSFLHIVEPSVEYTFIPSAKIMPLFDATELPVRTSVVTLGLYNKLMFKGLDVSLRLTQPYDFHNGNIITAEDISNIENGLVGTTTVSHHSVQPTRLEGAVTGPAFPVNFTFDTAYDFSIDRLSNLNSGVNFQVFRDITLGLSERYSRIDNLMLYSIGFNIPLGNHWLAKINSSYDAKGPGLREFAIGANYKDQCWNVNLLTTRTPGDQIRPPSYSYIIMIGLKGLGLYKL